MCVTLAVLMCTTHENDIKISSFIHIYIYIYICMIAAAERHSIDRDETIARRSMIAVGACRYALCLSLNAVDSRTTLAHLAVVSQYT